MERSVVLYGPIVIFKLFISTNSDDRDGDEKKTNETSKAEEINDNTEEENEAFEEESFCIKYISINKTPIKEPKSL